jgi:hypothetical protein
MGRDGPEVPMLTSSNYWEWRVRIEERLIIKDLDEHISEGVAVRTEEQRRDDRKALALIRSHVGVQLLAYLHGVNSARDAWKKLETVNQPALQVKTVHLEEQLLHLKMQKGEDMTEYCARAWRVQLELACVGQPVDDQKVIKKILMGLPESFSSVRDTALRQGTVDVDEIVAQLKVAEARMSQNIREKATALTADDTKKLDKRRNKKGTCFRCGKLGHIKRDCPLGQQNTQLYTAAISAIRADTVTEGESEDILWFTDSGATEHIVGDARFAHNLRNVENTVMIGSRERVG